jgi:hypothetical protein
LQVVVVAVTSEAEHQAVEEQVDYEPSLQPLLLDLQQSLLVAVEQQAQTESHLALVQHQP